MSHLPSHPRPQPLQWVVALALMTACANTSPEVSPLTDTSTSTPPSEDWSLVWEDDFDGEAGTSPSALNWTFDVGTGSGGWGNAQLEYDTDRPENASLDGEGNLQITARAESFGGMSYTSARMLTRGRFQQAYGRFEARIKLPTGAGIWPAFWMLGDDFQQVGWPSCGELDIMEYRGQEPNRVMGTAHGPGYSAGQGVGGDYTLPDGERFDADFHRFTLTWDPGRITWAIDDEVYFVLVPSKLPAGTSWVFDHPFFIILNVAVGGHFVGDPNPNTVFPQTMSVDYVRVYERTP